MLGPCRSFVRAPIEMAAPGLDLCARPEPDPGLGGAVSRGERVGLATAARAERPTTDKVQNI